MVAELGVESLVETFGSGGREIRKQVQWRRRRLRRRKGREMERQWVRWRRNLEVMKKMMVWNRGIRVINF